MKAAITRLEIAIENLKANQVIKSTRAREREIKQLEKAIVKLNTPIFKRIVTPYDLK